MVSGAAYLIKRTSWVIMAIAIFVELYLLVLGNWRPIWRFGLLSIYLILLILSQSVTSLLCAVLYLAGTAIYSVGKHDKLAGLVVAITLDCPCSCCNLPYGTMQTFC